MGEDVAREKENTEILRLLAEIKGRQRGQVFYAQRRIKGEKQREQNRLAEKKKFDRTLIDKAKQELRAFLGNQNAGSEVVARPAITNSSSRVEENVVQRSQDDEDRRREVQARLDQLLEENKTERKKEQERRDRTKNSQEGASNSESTFYKSMSIVEARKELERMEKENKEKLESSKREEEKKRREQERKEEERKRKEKKEKEEKEEKERAAKKK